MLYIIYFIYYQIRFTCILYYQVLRWKCES